MAYPVLYDPTKHVILTAIMTDVATASSAWIQCPVDGYIVEAGSIIETATTAAAAAITVEINGTAVTGLSWTIADASAAGAVDSDTVPLHTATALVKPGDSIEFISDGGGDTASVTNFYVVIRKIGAGAN